MSIRTAALTLLLLAAQVSVADFNSVSHPACDGSTCFGFNWQTVSPSQLDGFNPAAIAAGGETPLFMAARYSDNPNVIMKLINNGGYAIVVAAEDKTWYVRTYKDLERWESFHVVETPLFSAAKYSDSAKVVDTLIRAGDRLRPGGKGATALHKAAASNDNPKIARQLIAAGISVNMTDGSLTPLHEAAIAKNVDMIEFLLQAGALVNLPSTRGGYSPLHYAQDKNSIELLLAAGAKVNSRSDTADTPLHVLLTTDPGEDAVELLVEAGADTSARGSKGQTPFDVACGNKLAEGILQMLAVTSKQKDHSC